jgi:hypothetical protein
VKHSESLDEYIAQHKFMQQQPTVAWQPKEGKGLSEVVCSLLGKPLDKREQMSDWERCPLRLAQKYYAGMPFQFNDYVPSAMYVEFSALDAYCLIEVHKILDGIMKAKGLVIPQNQPNKATSIQVNRKTKQERRQQRVAQRESRGKPVQENPPPRDGPPLSPADFHVVCDTMLQGLGRFLRCCGVDVSFLESSDDHEKAAEVGFCIQ